MAMPTMCAVALPRHQPSFLAVCSVRGRVLDRAGLQQAVLPLWSCLWLILNMGPCRCDFALPRRVSGWPAGQTPPIPTHCGSSGHGGHGLLQPKVQDDIIYMFATQSYNLHRLIVLALIRVV